MRTIREMFMTTQKIRGALISATALAILSTLATACGELTGPVSPSTPTGVIATLASPTSATIRWTPSPLNDGVISYSVFRNGAKVGESTTTTYTDSGLSPQTTYVYSIAANCTSGIVSDRSVENAASTITTVDLTPPRVVANQPPTNFVGVSPAATVTVTFSESMDPATINVTTFTLRVTGGTAIAGTVTYVPATRVATFTPATSLPNPVNITATVTTGVKDLAGNAMAAPFTFAFTTRDDTGPTVIATSPVNGASGVVPAATVNVTFSEAMDASTINGTNFTLRATGSGAAVGGVVTFNAATRVATFTPNVPLAQTTGYTATIAAAVKDSVGNLMGVPFSFTFTTGDTNSPTVTAVVPINGAANVALNTTVTVTFSEAMAPASITTTTFNLRNTATSTIVPATVAYTAASNSATLTPTAPLAGNTGYTVTVTTGARDAAGNALGSQFTSAFTTLNPDTTRPTVTVVNPANNATGVATSTTVQVTFSEAMDAATISGTSITLRNTVTSAAVAATVSYNAVTRVATLTPTGPLSNATNYTFTVSTAVTDVAGNALASQFNSTFTTALAPDNTAPTIVARSPSNGSTNIAVNSDATVTFSEPMNPSTIDSTNITLAPTAGGPAIAAIVTYDAGTNTATLNPAADLANNTSYTLTITTGVKDVAGNALAANSTSTFTTVVDTTPPTVISRTPTAATGVPDTTNVTFTFSENMAPLTINGTTVTLYLTVDGPVTGLVPGLVTYDAITRTATLNPSASLAPSKNYTATVTTGATDTAGNPLTGTFSFTFTTAP